MKLSSYLFTSLEKLAIPYLRLRRKFSTFLSDNKFSIAQTPPFYHSHIAHLSMSPEASNRIVRELLAEVEREKQREREERKRAGLDTKDIDAEDEEDYMGVGPLIEKLENEKLKYSKEELYLREEPTDSESDEDDAIPFDVAQRLRVVFQKKVDRHKELIEKFTGADTLEDTINLINKINKFEERHFRLRPEYRVIGELINRLKVAEGKDRFILQHKLNRGMKLIQWKEDYDLNKPENYGAFQDRQVGVGSEPVNNAGAEKQEPLVEGDSEDEEFDDMKERENVILQKLTAIDKKLEEGLSQLDHTFGKKGKVLEEEIRNLAEERNALTQKTIRPMSRRGFDVKMLDRKRGFRQGEKGATHTVILACGNYHGLIGFAKAKGPSIQIACERAQNKCFQNLHYIELHKDHTIAHSVVKKYKKTKVYLWPSRTRTGVRAGKTVQTILGLAGFTNVKSKIIGSKNPLNTVKALFSALNAVETPKDVQEKFGRTVVETYLL